jgi:hypothetical protein
MAEDKYIDIDKLLLRQFKEQQEFEKKLREQDEKEGLSKKERDKLKDGGRAKINKSLKEVTGRGQGNVRKFKITRLY